MKNLSVSNFVELSMHEAESTNGGGRSGSGGSSLLNFSVGDILSGNHIANGNFNCNTVNVGSIVGNILALGL
ncbi:hypothetical protein [Solitalea koreensis]|uniref:Uncharacterized protein n=1 Tax=Solitalea koreensis TaxID=543615 RepID=A0A521CUH2_9SPHI|nr:hypothetical protein [Solitalea koreensis]SMO62310.1 hypothetical protein SAMN06265350_104314 [Solitalea koreensis]